MTIVAQANGVGSIPSRRAPRPVASSIAANAAPREPVVGVELVQGVDGLPRLPRARHLSSPLRAFRRSRRSWRRGAPPPKATAPWPASRFPSASRRCSPAPKKSSRKAINGATSSATIWCWPRLSCQKENVSAGPVSLAGSFHSKIRATKNMSPASAPASVRKRSNRSEVKRFLSSGCGRAYSGERLNVLNVTFPASVLAG